MLWTGTKLKNRWSECGFTLMEVMVALTIFVIAILGCYRLQVISSGSDTRADSIATAATWAQYMAEDLLSRQFATYYTDPLLVNSKGDTVNGLTNINNTDNNADGIRYVGYDDSLNTSSAVQHKYTIYWNIVDDRPLKSIKQIRIIVVKNGGLNKGQLYTQDYFKLGPI